jgi:EmrB/QacA subfamily drug resistance transporter
MQDQPAVSEPEPASGLSRKGALLAVCCVAQFMVILDLSIVNVALPSIQSSLRFSASGLQWVVDAYAIMFAGFLMLAGRGADIFGARRTFVLALGVFSVASVGGGLAPSSDVLLLARAVQGLGGALMAASSLAIITSSFAAGPERHRAISLWGAMNGAGGAVGVLLGGVITQELSWRWVLLINAPIGLVTVFVALSVVAHRPGSGRRGLDLPGALVLTIGLLIEAYGAVTAGNDGWGSASALVPIAIGAVLLSLFPLIEKRVPAPLVPPGSLTKPLRRINLIVLLFSASLFPMWYVGSLYMQQVLALSPVQTGLAFLPMALTIFACASQAGKVISRAGVRPVLGGGLIMMATGMALFGRIAAGGSAIQYIVLPGVLTAIGIGFSVVASTIGATQSAGMQQSGLASGLVNSARQIGGGLGLAVLISIGTQYTTHLIGESRELSQALTDGFRIAYLIGAGLCALAALLTFVWLPGRRRAMAAAAAGPPTPGPPTPSPGLAMAAAAGPPAPSTVTAPVPSGPPVPNGAATPPPSAPPASPAQSNAGRWAMGAALLVAVCFVAVDFGITQTHAAPIGAYTTKGTLHFVTAPKLHPPQLAVAQQLPQGQSLPGDIMTANFYDVTDGPIIGQSGPMILDSNLDPVWFQPVPTNVVASNLEAQTYDGKPVLSWWQGDVTSTGEIESGEDVVVNNHYQKIATLKGVDGWVLTLHEMLIRGDDAWVTANRNVPDNLSNDGGVSNGVLTDSAVQEYSLKTGKLLYSWDASKHIPLSDSYAIAPSNGFPFDAYHVNSISLAGNGTFLVSMRNTWAAYLVDARTGKIIWTLGGKRSSFKVPAAAQFQWQHDVNLVGSNTVTMFDDHCCQITGAGQYLKPTAPSRGLVLKLNTATKTATEVAQFTHDPTFNSQYMGNLQTLPGGDSWVSWGDASYMSLYSSTGKLLFDAAFPAHNMTYRAYVQKWVGLPLTLPSGAARPAHNGVTTVYASWNGATQVTSWRVLGVGAGGATKSLTTVPKDGFETSMPVTGGSYTRFEVQALGAGKKVLGTSKTFITSR